MTKLEKRLHEEPTYCPNCEREVYPASIKIILDAEQLNDLLSNRTDRMKPVIEYIRKNVELVK